MCETYEAYYYESDSHSDDGDDEMENEPIKEGTSYCQTPVSE